MDEARRYTIYHVNDFLDVPPDRLAACLREFRVALELFRATAGAVVATAEGQGVSVPPNSCTLSKWTWIDDGARRARVEFLATSIAAGDGGRGEEHHEEFGP